MRIGATCLLALSCLGTPPAHAQAPQPPVAQPCTAAPQTPGCPAAAAPRDTPNTATRAPGSGEMQTSPTGMMTDSAKQPSPPEGVKR